MMTVTNDDPADSCSSTETEVVVVDGFLAGNAMVDLGKVEADQELGG